MKQIFHRLRKRRTEYKEIGSLIATASLVFLAITSSMVIAASTSTGWNDDFEDGDSDGWKGAKLSVVTNSTNGAYSLRQDDNIGDHSNRGKWVDGPTLNTSKEFHIEGTIRTGQGSGSLRTTVGLQEDSPNGSFIVFSGEHNATYLAEVRNEDPTADMDTISRDFDGVWVNVIMEGTGNGTVRAKVWETGTTKPSSWQLTRNFTSQASEFSIDSGAVDHGNRYIEVDDVNISGTENIDSRLEIDSRSHIDYGKDTPYAIYYEKETAAERNETKNVTDHNNTSVRSMNTDGITVDEQKNILVATNNKTFADRVEIRAEYNGSVQYKEVTVSPVDIQHLAILPPMYRISATLGDDTIFLFIIMILTGIAATRLSTAFGGISMMEMVAVIGWMGGYVGDGMVMVSVFTSMFIGLNLAANINYQVRR